MLEYLWQHKPPSTKDSYINTTRYCVETPATEISIEYLVPWLSTTVTSTSRYLTCGRALRSTPCRGDHHRVGKGGRMGTGKETGTAREGQWGRNMTKTKKGEASANREGSGDGVKKGVSWWRMCRSTWSPTRAKLPIRFGTYNICNSRNGVL